MTKKTKKLPVEIEEATYELETCCMVVGIELQIWVNNNFKESKEMKKHRADLKKARRLLTSKLLKWKNGE